MSSREHKSSFIPILLVACGLAAAAVTGARALAGEPLAAVPPTRPVDFESDVLPIFRRSCLACHNAARAEGDLVLETPARILAGGASGPAVLPGKGEESLLFRLAAHGDDPVMPPDGNDRAAPRLSAAQLGIVRAWIDAGAKGEVRGTRPLVWQPPAADRMPVHAVAVSADGGLVAAGRADGIFVHETFGGGVVGPLVDPDLPLGGLGRAGASHVSTVESLAFSPDGRRLASGDFRTLRIWKRGEPQPTWRRELPEAAGEGITVATIVGGTRAACGLADGRVIVASLGNSDGGGDGLPATLAGHVGRVTAIVPVPGGEPRLLTAAADGTIRLWDLTAAREIGRIDAGGAARQLGVVAGGGKVAAIGADGGVRVWPLPAGPPPPEPAPPREILPAGAGVTCLAVVDEPGTRLVVGGTDGTVRMHDVEQGRELARGEAGGSVTALAAAPAAGRIVVGTAAGRVTVFAVKPDAKLEIVAKAHAEKAAAPALDPLDFARQRAGLAVAAAREDLDAAMKERDAERAASYAAILEVAKTDVERVKKEAAAAAPAAALAAAEEALEKARAEAAAAAEADKAKGEAAVKAAEEMVTKARAAAETAGAERRRAEEAHAAAKVTVERVAESVARAVAAAARAELAHDEAREREKAAADELALATRGAAAAGERLDRLAAEARGGAHDAAIGLPAAAAGGIEAAARAVEEAEMASMRSAMQAMTLVQRSEDARKMAEQMAGEADKGVVAAKTAVEQATKEADEARQKLAAAADDEAKKLRGADLAVAEKKAATARADLAAAEQRLARVAATREKAAADAVAAVPQAETLKTDAERRLGEARQRLEAATVEARKAAAADGQGAAIDARLEAWRRERAAALLEQDRQPIAAVAVAPDGAWLVFADDAGIVRRAAAADGRTLGTIAADAVVAAGIAADGGVVVVGPHGIARWPRDPGWVLERRIGGPTDAATFSGAVTAVALSPDGGLVATGGGTPSRSGEIALWRVETGDRVAALPDAHSDAVLALDFSPAGDLLASGSADRTVRVFDVAKGSVAAGFEGHQQHVLGVAWRADGRLLASASADGTVKTWDLRRGELRKSQPPLPGEATGVRYLAAGDTLVATAAEGRIHVRTSDGGNAQSFAGSGTCLHALAGSRMGRVIAAGGEDGTVQVFDAAGKPLVVLRP